MYLELRVVIFFSGDFTLLFVLYIIIGFCEH